MAKFPQNFLHYLAAIFKQKDQKKHSFSKALILLQFLESSTRFLCKKALSKICYLIINMNLKF